MSRKRLLAAAAAALLLLSPILALVLRVPLARAAYRWLTLPASVEKSEVIFVMGGFIDERLPYAVKLFKKGLGGELWLAAGKTTAAHREFERAFGFRVDEPALQRRAIEAAGLPAGRVRFLEGSLSTWTDLSLMKQALRERPASSVLIVSSPYHFRRIAFVLGRLFPVGGPEFRFAYPDPAASLARVVSDDKLLQLVGLELAKNLAYRLEY